MKNFLDYLVEEDLGVPEDEGEDFEIGNKMKEQKRIKETQNQNHFFS